LGLSFSGSEAIKSASECFEGGVGLWMSFAMQTGARFFRPHRRLRVEPGSRGRDRPCAATKDRIENEGPDLKLCFLLAGSSAAKYCKGLILSRTVGSSSAKLFNTPTRRTRSGGCACSASGHSAENSDELALP
jgi:hypothetical protein